MRFVVITSFVGLTSATDLVCSEDIGRTAESQGFVSFIYNCVWNADTTIGSQACLGAFIDDNAADNPFPITGTCRDIYQTLVNSWAVNIKANCPLADILPSSIPVNVDTAHPDCVSLGLNNNANVMARIFYDATGFFPFRMCTGAQVRKGDIASYFDKTCNSGTWDGIPGFTACSFCYETVFRGLIQYGSPPADVKEACLGTGFVTESCLSTTLMTKAREGFLQCAGYDMLITGDMCTSDAAVEALIPTPYYTFVECAHNPGNPICSTVQEYLNENEIVTNSVDCLACYTEFQSDIIALAADTSNKICRNDLYSDACIVYLADALKAFETCSGFSLDTVPAAATLPTTTAAPVVETTTESTSTATTLAATTTKAASLYWIPVLGFFLSLL